MISTRLATLADLDEVAVLFDAYRQFYEQKPDLDLARAFIQQRLERNQSQILLAEQNGALLGFCQLYPLFCSLEAMPIYSLYDLFVSPSARRAGVGRALLQAAEDLARQHGFARLDLTTAKTNHTAQHLYRSQGWVRDEVFDAYQRWVNHA
jgi:ribosomal protein S18 acetylase RimI-like enzyme